MSISRDDLGNRMKAAYENRTRFMLPRRTWTLLRIDGVAFHTYTRGCDRPYDLGLMADMDATARELCERVQGARMAFVQSDEISVLLTDFGTPTTEAWFDGNVQKIVSVAASIATQRFNLERELRQLTNAVFKGIRPKSGIPLFDCRAWTIPDRYEVFNYFLWRQQDATRNSIQMTANAHFSLREQHRKSCDELQEMLWREKQVNWNDSPVGFKRGRVVMPVTETKEVEYVDRRSGNAHSLGRMERREWKAVEPPIFTQDREWLFNLIPEMT